MKTILFNILLLFFLLFSTLFGEENWPKINQIIWNEEGVFNDTKNGKRNSENKKQDSILTDFFGKKKSVENMGDLEEFLIFLKKNAYRPSRYHVIIQDETILKILLSIVAELEDRKIAYRIYTYLFEKRNYKLYKKNSDKLKYAIMKEPFGGSQASLLLLCELNDEDKSKLKREFNILFHEKLPYYIRIRLGDKNAEDTLIQMFNKELQFESNKKLISELELAGTAKCEMALVNSLGKKNVVQYSDMYSYSIAFYIIQALGELNPESNILNDDFLDFKKEIEKDGFNVDLNVKHTKKYLENVYNFILLRYGVKIEELKNIDFIYSFKVNETPASDAQLYELQRQLNGK